MVVESSEKKVFFLAIVEVLVRVYHAKDQEYCLHLVDFLLASKHIWGY